MSLFRGYQDEDRMVREVAQTAFYDVTDSIIDAHTAVKVLALTFAAEAGGIAMTIIAKDKVKAALADSEGDAWIYAGAAVFLVGFLFVFAIYKLAARKWPHPGAAVFLWLVPIAAGALNVLLFFALLTLERR